MRRRGALVLGLFTVIVLFAAPARAITPTETLKPAAEEVTRILEDPALKSLPQDRQARVRAVMNDLFDYPEIAMRVLGRHWRSLSQSERDEFVQLFRAFLEHTYLPKISLYQGERVRFVGESVDGDLATVQALVITKKGKEVPIAYRMDLRDGRWRVYDISVEGISFVANYRSQFDQVLTRRSFRDLTERLKQKLAAPPDPTPSGLSPFR
jgi:phospholipid transport system substrate-binding protein